MSQKIVFRFEGMEKETLLQIHKKMFSEISVPIGSDFFEIIDNGEKEPLIMQYSIPGNTDINEIWVALESYYKILEANEWPFEVNSSFALLFPLERGNEFRHVSNFMVLKTKTINLNNNLIDALEASNMWASRCNQTAQRLEMLEYALEQAGIIVREEPEPIPEPKLSTKPTLH